jgi:hypothetical protein
MRFSAGFILMQVFENNLLAFFSSIDSLVEEQESRVQIKAVVVEKR